MPVLKSYKDKEGYYINARPSDVGNVTYQVDRSLWDFLEYMDYRHESEIEWSLVKSFRLAGLIYTEGQGVEDIDEDVPELDPSKLSDLTEDRKQEILEYIDSRDDLSPEMKKKIRQYILEQIGEEEDADIPTIVEAVVETVLGSSTFNSDWTLDGVSVSESIEQHWRVTDIEIVLENDRISLTEGGVQRVTHSFSTMVPVDEGVEDYLTTWSVDTERDPSWETTIDILAQKAVLPFHVKNGFEERGLYFGEPDLL